MVLNSSKGGLIVSRGDIKGDIKGKGQGRGTRNRDLFEGTV